MPNSNIHPHDTRLTSRTQKEQLLGAQACVFWLFGISGSGKSTLAMELEKKLHHENIYSIVLDGDNLRDGLNKDLGFSENDRRENIRRVSEVAKTLCEAGQVTIVSCITPKNEFRDHAKKIVGPENFYDIYVKASYSECSRRDVKGLYAKASANQIDSFTGKNSEFEEPVEPTLIIETEFEEIDHSVTKLFSFVSSQIKRV